MHDRCVRRRHLRRERDRIRLDAQPAVLRADLELVRRALLDARNEELPDAGRAERAHRVQAPVPRVEVADDGDRARVRRPDGERRAGDAVDLAHVRAELLVQLLVTALHCEVEVEVAERRQERVRVAQREGAPVRVLDLELVLERQLRLRQQRLPEARRILQRRLDALRAARARPAPPGGTRARRRRRCRPREHQVRGARVCPSSITVDTGVSPDSWSQFDFKARSPRFVFDEIAGSRRPR